MDGDCVLTLHLGHRAHQCAKILWNIRQSSNDMGPYSTNNNSDRGDQPKCVLVDSFSAFKQDVEDIYNSSQDNISLSSWDGEVERVVRDR